MTDEHKVMHCDLKENMLFFRCFLPLNKSLKSCLMPILTH